MEIINSGWLTEINKLVKSRIAAVENALAKAKEEGKEIIETEKGYTWNNHMGTAKFYSFAGTNAMKEFVRMFESGELNIDDWEKKMTYEMWTEMALALYYGDVKGVCAGISFIDVRDYIFSKIIKA